MLLLLHELADIALKSSAGEIGSLSVHACMDIRVDYGSSGSIGHSLKNAAAAV